MRPDSTPRTRDVGLVLGGLAMIAAAGGLLTRAGFAPAARRLLKVHFTPVQPDMMQALAIWAHNSRFLFGIALFAVCVRVARSGVMSAGARVILTVCDLIVVVWAAGTAALAGVLLGAYGTRQLSAFLPQGPVEVLAWALLIAIYIDVRSRRPPITQVLARLATVEVLLATAAILELWVGR